MGDDRVAELEAALAASRRTVAALTERVESLEGGPIDSQQSMARALAGMQRELRVRTASLEESEATWRALYEGSPSPLLTVDPDGLVIACNRTGLVWLGLPLDEVVGAPLTVHLDGASATSFDDCRRRGYTGLADRRFTLRDGRTVVVSAAPIQGPRARHHLTLHDVTTRRALEEATSQGQRMDALAELAGSIARELNDPMSIVQGRLELLLELGVADQPERVEKHLQVALEHARRVSATLRNLRLVGRGRADSLEAVVLVRAIDEALDILGPRRSRVVIDLDADDLAAGGDTATVARVVSSLLRRVLDHSRTANIRGQRREGVVLQIGPGTAVASGQPHPGAFDLAIVRTLLEAIGGRVEAGRIGGAPLFNVHLPPAPGRRARARKVDASLLAVGRESLGHTLDGLLAREGFEVVWVADAEAALSWLESGHDRIQGVATELMLAGMSGLTLADEISQRWPDLRGRVLLISGARLGAVPPSVVPISPPLDRLELLSALGRRVRRRHG